MNFRDLNVLLVGFACLFAGQANASNDSAGQQWQFDVLLDGKPIGFQTFDVQQDGSATILTTEASFDVKFLFITAFRYRHSNVETWSGDCLESIDAKTDSNGKLLEVRGEQDENRFAVESTTGARTLDACVQTFAYWNPAILNSARLLNSQTGEYEDVTVTFESRDEVRVGDETVDALRYRLSANGGDIRLWYASADRRWLALEAPAKGGRTIRYQPEIIPGSNDYQQQFARSN